MVGTSCDVSRGQPSPRTPASKNRGIRTNPPPDDKSKVSAIRKAVSPFDSCPFMQIRVKPHVRSQSKNSKPNSESKIPSDPSEPFRTQKILFLLCSQRPSE